MTVPAASPLATSPIVGGELWAGWFLVWDARDAKA